jgi:hypothetical protein
MIETSCIFEGKAVHAHSDAERRRCYTMSGLIILIIVMLAVCIFTMYNTLVGKKNQVENAFGSMDLMLKKR